MLYSHFMVRMLRKGIHINSGDLGNVRRKKKKKRPLNYDNSAEEQT